MIFGRCSRAGAVAPLGTLLLLAACAAPARFESDAALQPLRYEAEGRLSVVAPDDYEPSRAVNLTGKFLWVERERSTEVSLSSPLGDTLARVQMEPGRVELRVPGETELGPTPEVLFERRIGVALPVSGLRHWLEGRNAAGQSIAPQGAIEDGWTITYPQMDGDRPRLVRLDRSDPRVVQVRIVIDRWS